MRNATVPVGSTRLLSDAEHDEDEVEQHGPEGRNVLGTDHGERGREQFGGQTHGLIATFLRHPGYGVLHRSLAEKQAAVLHPSHGRQMFTHLRRVLFEQKYIGTHPL